MPPGFSKFDPLVGASSVTTGSGGVGRGACASWLAGEQPETIAAQEQTKAVRAACRMSRPIPKIAPLAGALLVAADSSPLGSVCVRELTQAWASRLVAGRAERKPEAPPDR